MSPEQCVGETEIDGRADVYALGCMLFEMACGRRPFLGDTPRMLLAEHISAKPPAPRELDPSLPAEELEDIPFCGTTR